jgi:hypothetical protein
MKWYIIASYSRVVQPFASYVYVLQQHRASCNYPAHVIAHVTHCVLTHDAVCLFAATSLLTSSQLGPGSSERRSSVVTVHAAEQEQKTKSMTKVTVVKVIDTHSCIHIQHTCNTSTAAASTTALLSLEPKLRSAHYSVY